MSSVVTAQATGNAPIPALQDIGIDQKLNAQIPADLTFQDDTGRTVQLGEYFKSGKPIILTLVYYECPSLCTVVLNDTLRTLRGMSQLSIGKDFQVLTISFDPREKPELAAAKKDHYVKAYGRPDGAAGWHFMTGDEANIRKLTETVGFRYRYDPKQNQYLHVAGIMVLTPEGRVSRYFYGVDYELKDLRLSLVEASTGRIGSVADQVLLYCFHYDPTTGKYTLAVLRLLKISAALTVLGIAAMILILFRRERRAQAQAAAESKL